MDTSYVVKTYRYLRLAMVALVALMFVAVLVEWWQTGRRCFQTTLSAYYYTPAQAVFVSSLVAIGVCLVVIKGNTETEDVLLNIAGILAPIVAFVPTPGAGDCWSTPVNTDAMPANVANTVTALLVVGVLALLGVLVAVSRAGWPPGAALGWTLAAATVVGFGVWFVVGRPSFLHAAHYVAAITLFTLITLVVLINAVRYHRQERCGPARNPYALVAALMIGSAVVFGLLAWLTNWRHALLWLEVAEISLFAVFWLIQTKELWHDGLRPLPPATA